MQDMSENIRHCGRRDSGKDDVRACNPVKKPKLPKDVIAQIKLGTKLSNDYITTLIVVMWKENSTNCYSNRSGVHC